MSQSKLKLLHVKSFKLYLRYTSGDITLDEYLLKLKLLDDCIEKLELYCILDLLQNNATS